MDLIIGLLLYISIFVLMHDDLKKYYSKKPLVNLKHVNLTERQRVYIKGILEGKSLKDIATSLYVSESVVKREIRAVYEVFTVENHKELLKLFNEHNVII